mmetsp:Transcript_13885/g.25855  ORF Transcript_13885/g.25855 Transcript_13885/m.25855 type:complete len:285 (-) Transcript_13885:108-962(-)
MAINLKKRTLQGAQFTSDFASIGAESNENIFTQTEDFGSKLLEEEARLIDKVFQIVDKDQEGTIDQKKLMNMFKLFNVENLVYVQSAIQKVMVNVDRDNNGLIDREEFASVLSSKFEEGDPEDEMLGCFKEMGAKEKNNELTLGVKELKQIAEDMGEDDMDETEIRSMICNLLKVHKRRQARLEREGAVLQATKSKAKDEFHGKIVQKLGPSSTESTEPVFFLQCEAMKDVGKRTTLGCDLRGTPFKAGDWVKFTVDSSGKRAASLKDPELHWSAFESVMREEL